MLHEILLSLSGYPSPLLTTNSASATTPVILSPSEKALLASVAHLSDLNCKLLTHTSEIPTTHTSNICQAIALSIKSTHLTRFQRKVLDVENGILRRDAGSVGAYNIVPLTAVVGEFSDWTRRMEWFWEIIQFMMKDGCTGAQIINKLCDSVQTGYSDIEEAALQLVKVAETAWLKQASAWILYGRLPFSGQQDFFIHRADDDIAEEYIIEKDLLPGFVGHSAAASILFIGRSLNHIRVKGTASSSSSSLGLVPLHLQLLSSLPSPITPSSLSSVISAIRLSLSQSALEKLLPLRKISEILSLLHEFFLLGRGEFAIALISEADEKSRSRWRRSDNLAYDKRDRLGNIVIKDGEVSAILARTWAALSSQQGVNDDEEQLDLARDLVHLSIIKSPFVTGPRHNSSAAYQYPPALAQTPFNNLLLSIPTQLSFQIPSPLDLFLTANEVQIYSSVNAYLLSIRRAHLRLTDLWKITSLRRDHPAPPAPPYGSTVTGRAIVQERRTRATERGRKIRALWATSSAALFLLGETESYLHGEIIEGTWSGFQRWVTGKMSRPSSPVSNQFQGDLWAAAASRYPSIVRSQAHSIHDPQTLSEAHKRYLNCLTQDLLLTTPTFTEPLYHLLQQIDHLVALVHRIHSIWQSLDLEADEGVVDAFSDFHKEEKDVEEQLVVIGKDVKTAIEILIQSLRDIDQEKDDRYDSGFEAMFGENAYMPQRMGRVDRLLMKLDFGGWFDVAKEDQDQGIDDDGLDD